MRGIYEHQVCHIADSICKAGQPGFKRGPGLPETVQAEDAQLPGSCACRDPELRRQVLSALAELTVQLLTCCLHHKSNVLG